jgi:hypothetical protein
MGNHRGSGSARVGNGGKALVFKLPAADVGIPGRSALASEYHVLPAGEGVEPERPIGMPPGEMTKFSLIILETAALPSFCQRCREAFIWYSL